MKYCIEKSGNVNDEFKRKIVSLRAYTLIPILINTIENQEEIKDPYILTSLCLLMRFDYEPFRKSEIYNKLYPTDSAGFYISKKAYENSVRFTQSNYKTIIDFASDYFEYKKKKTSEFIHISKGEYSIGEKGHSSNPLRKVKLEPFKISRYEITNKQFEQFIQSTGYVTLAEKNKDAFVFRLGLDEFEWIEDSTAYWRFPNGISEGGIDEKMNHPVTCISFIDVEAYCNWANLRLPTIEEWEVASRAGNYEERHYFGEIADDIYQHANIWHGKTHLMKYEGEDYITTSPVGSYKPNQLGIYDIYGNVFEFCSNIPESFNIYENVVATRGGSWWCSQYSCGFFNSVDIGRVQKEATFSNNGFRVVR
jgi:sulfatase modifying factor 1